MAKKILFGILGFFAGLVFAVILVSLVEEIGNRLHPYPPGVMELKGEELYAAMCKQVETYPDWVLGIVTLLWGATITVSVWIATRIGGRVSGVLLGLLLLAMLLLNVWIMGLPYPLWFKVTEIATFPLFVLTGLFLLASPRSSKATPVKAEQQT